MAMDKGGNNSHPSPPRWMKNMPSGSFMLDFS